MPTTYPVTIEVEAARFKRLRDSLRMVVEASQRKEGEIGPTLNYALGVARWALSYEPEDVAAEHNASPS